MSVTGEQSLEAGSACVILNVKKKKFIEAAQFLY